ncbi:MAG: DUF1893 domain-containing protein [Akkermansia sp.]
MQDLQTILINGNHSLVVAKGSEIRCYQQRGVADIHHLLHHDPDFLQGSRLADKIIGKGAAACMIAGGVIAISTNIISQAALNLLQQYSIPTSYNHCVPHIINRSKTGPCPLESKLGDETDIDRLIPLIDDFVAQLKTN